MLTIFHAIPSLGESGGGPSRSVSQLCEALLECGASITLVTKLYEDDPIVPLNPAIELRTHTGHGVGILQGLQPSGLPELLMALWRSSSISVIHQHGIWLRSTHEVASFASRVDLPLVVSPRGMLEPWAMNHHKWKKKIAWLLYQQWDLQRATVFHATAFSEAESIRRLGFKQPIAVIPNGVRLQETGKLGPQGGKLKSVSYRGSKRTVLFLSRINPKKGLPMLLDAWKALSPDGWRLVIAGNDDGKHLPVAERKIRELGLGGVVELVGPLFGVDKERAFLDADLFVLPSYSENFGIVVPEALSYRVPVITTKGTPWADLEKHDCGWWVDIGVEPLVQALQAAITLSDEERRAMGSRGQVYVQRYKWDGIAKQMIEVYRWMLKQRLKPDCVLTD